MVKDQEAVGVTLKDGTEIRAKVVMSNATPKVTYLDLLQKVLVSSNYSIVSSSVKTRPPHLVLPSLQNLLPTDFYKEVSSIDYTSGATKINGTKVNVQNSAIISM